MGLMSSLQNGTLLRIPKGLYKSGDELKLINYENGQASILIDGIEHEISTVPADESSGQYSLVQSQTGSAASSKINQKYLVKIIDVSGSKSEKSKIQIVGQNVVSKSKTNKSDSSMSHTNRLTADFLEESDIE